jgi:GNAT superfamily N-acetyltransferase
VADLVSGQLLIRQATADDAPALAVLRYEFRAALATPRERRDAFVARCREWMQRQLRDADPAWRCWLAADVEEPVGSVWVYALPKIPNPVGEAEAHAYVTNLYVRPAFRGRGAGGRLLEAALAWCRSQSFDSAILWPTPASRSLYLRHGFEHADDLMELALSG